jgi:hypothetical protein
MSDPTIAEILAASRQALTAVELGLEDLRRNDKRRLVPSAMNVAVYGRMVTSALQRLRSRVDGFDDWYGPIQQEMSNDALLKYFYMLRTLILKKASIRFGQKAAVHFSSNDQLMQALGTPPQGAFAAVAINSDGLSGWRVRMPDGTEVFHAVPLPAGMSELTLHLPDAPREHLGQQLRTDSMADLGTLYFHYLRDLVIEAEAKFGRA